MIAALTARVVATGVIVGVAVVVAFVLAPLAGKRAADDVSRFQLRKTVRYVVVILALVALAIAWGLFGGRGGVFFGLLAAGFAFAMQEVVGAVAGWFNILSGGIFRVGDRIEMAGVQGDVIDLTPLRTKILEMGTTVTEPATNDPPSWVRGRQYTGRIVSISNKATFTDPVFNYSTMFEYIWEELTLPIPYRDDWKTAERIMLEEASRVSNTEGARQALETMAARYPVPRHELEPHVFVRATDNWMELAARFVVPVRTSRSVKDELTRRIRDRFDEAGIHVASTTMDVTVFKPPE